MVTRVAYLKAPWQFEIRHVELPDEPPYGNVLIKIEACGICGSDLTAAEEKAKEWKAFGHEVAGVIVKIDEGCEGLDVGQKVVLESSSFCGKCDLCRNGRVDLCNKAPNFWKEPAMGFSDYMIAPACCVVPYEGLTPEVACLAEPAGVAWDMVRTADIQMGDRVCVIGPGPIGLMAIPIALSRGAEKVVCIGRPGNEKRLEISGQLGAEPLLLHTGFLEQEELNQQFDQVLMTAPVRFLPEVFPYLAFGGRVTYIGIGTGSGMIQFDANEFHFRKLQLRASHATPAIYYPTVSFKAA
jgi:L-iditol 2-dehydrogenase